MTKEQNNSWRECCDYRVMERMTIYWVHGTHSLNYKFDAYVETIKSKNGYNGGRVTSISIWRDDKDGEWLESIAIFQNGGWELKPQSKVDYNVFAGVIHFLEDIVPKEDCKDS